MKTYGRASSEREHLRVGVADFAVTADGALLTTSGLGSCLGIGLYDETERIAGLAHVMLPAAPDAPENAAKFADTGIDAMVSSMAREGGRPDHMTAKLAGGSAMFDFDSQDDAIGERNLDATRTVLDARDIPVVAEDVGGSDGRSVTFDGDTGILVVKSAGDERRL
jgi:chemotaxis protein CheD